MHCHVSEAGRSDQVRKLAMRGEGQAAEAPARVCACRACCMLACAFRQAPWPPAPWAPAHACLPTPPGAHGPSPARLACLGRGFKALKQIIKIQSRLGNAEEMVAAYRQLLQARPAHAACTACAMVPRRQPPERCRPGQVLAGEEILHPSDARQPFTRTCRSTRAAAW